MKTSRKEWKTGWWMSWQADAWNSNVGFEKFILPWLSFTPWHKSILASIPEFAETKSISIQLGWWVWRLRVTVGFTLRLPTQANEVVACNAGDESADCQ